MQGIERLADTPIGIEIPRLEAGEPWLAAHVAGLQFYDYDQDDGLDGRVRPKPGDRLNLVRAPDNPHDGNAVEVWWRNEFRLGHLPRGVAREVAPELDAGRPLRAYVWHGGDGSAWSMDMMLIGAAVAERHGQWVEQEARYAAADLRNAERVRRRGKGGLVHGRIIGDEQYQRRLDRLAQAVKAFSKLPWEPDLPPVGASVEAEVLADRIGSSTSTVHAIAKRAGIEKGVRRRGRFAWALPYELTPELRGALLDWCRKPRAIGRQQVANDGRR